MTEINGCTVELNSGRLIDDCGVLFKENGWIRVRRGGKREYFPPNRVGRVETGSFGGER